LHGSGVSKVFSPGEAQFDSKVDYTLQNKRFAKSGRDYHQPYAISFPQSNQEVSAAVKCAHEAKLLPLARCGGHSYEGFSYRAETPFMIIDLINMTDIVIDKERKVLV
jgi:FAD/FMN-containing dehydrogenase